jgi:hypothetical protein
MAWMATELLVTPVGAAYLLLGRNAHDGSHDEAVWYAAALSERRPST